MISYRRPHGSKTERKFISRFIDSVPGMRRDGFGNRFVKIGASRTLFSAHIDTVHAEGGQQEIEYVSKTGILKLPKMCERKSARYGVRFASRKDAYYRNCLGTDDAAGIFLLLNMIAAKIPGLYVFHRGEERGGLGSEWLARNAAQTLRDIDRCIAFDRRGDGDIITHQMMQRCCSDEFALELAWQLDRSTSMQHEPSALGSFTDTANYTDHVGECTNVSVGYQYEHTSAEYQDAEYLLELLDSVLHIDYESLPSARRAGERDRSQYRHNHCGNDTITLYRRCEHGIILSAYCIKCAYEDRCFDCGRTHFEHSPSCDQFDAYACEICGYRVRHALLCTRYVSTDTDSILHSQFEYLDEPG